MLRNLVKAVVRGAVRDFTNQAAGLGLMFLAALVLLLAVAFAFLALFLGLSALIPSWAAALIVALVITVFGLLIALAGRNVMRRKRGLASAIDQQIDALKMEAREAGEKLGRENSLPLIIGAALVGIILGQNLRK